MLPRQHVQAVVLRARCHRCLRSEAQEIIAAHTVISLDADEESLFGYITSLSTDKHPTFEIPADRLPTFRRKRQGKGGSDGQLELSFDEFD